MTSGKLDQALVLIDKLAKKNAALEQERTEPIAIVGIGCRFPGGANSPEAFWELLDSGRDAVVPLDERWQLLGEHPSEDVPRWAGLLTEAVDQFDPAFFGISPREATKMDPQHRLLLEVTWEALENAAIPPRSLEGGRVGVFIGACSTDYLHTVSREPPEEQDAYNVTGNLLSIIAGRLSYTLGLQGPCMALDTACASSLVAIHLACRSLRARESNLALAGGINLILSLGTTEGLARTQALSPDGRCRTFDASANGFVRGEGCGVIVLKRLSDAKRDGDHIWALIRGSAVNQDGRSTGLTAPNVRAQEALIREALQNARVEAEAIGYVETHGTGTSLGDPIEVEALRAVLGTARPGGGQCVLGAAKTNLGHLEGAAGVAGLIKAVLALQHERIPRNLNFRMLNPRIRLEGTALALATEPVAWPRSDRPRFAGVSAFGLSGTNAHVVLEEAPAPTPAPAAPQRPAELVVLSAKSAPALDALAARLSWHLQAHPELALGDIAFSSATTRSPMEHRLAIAASSRDVLQSALDAAAKGETPAGAVRSTISSSRGKLAFLFTGQGAQIPGMGCALHAAFPVFREAFDRCAALFDQELPRPLREVMWAETGTELAALLDQTAFTQPALFTLEYALYALWQSWGLTPDLLAGHSIGELVAACVAGVFSLQDAVRLVAARGRLMQALPPGGAMVSIAATEADVALALAPHANAVSIAAINAPEQVVIAGAQDAVQAIAASFAARGVRTKQLLVSHAFHSPLMDPMLQAFERVAASISYHPPTMALVSNLTGALCTDEVTHPAYWVRHVRQAVRFADGVKALHQAGAATFIELGPRSTLLGLVTACLPDTLPTLLSSLRTGREDPSAVLEALGGFWASGGTIDWTRLFPAGGRRVPLPTYPWQRERYWIHGAQVDSANRLATPAPTSLQDIASRLDIDAFTAYLGAPELFSREENAVLEKVLSALARRFQKDAATVSDASPEGTAPSAASIPPILAQLQAAPPAERAPLLSKHLCTLIAHALGVKDASTIGPTQSLVLLGLDSFVGLQIQRDIARTLQITKEVPPSTIFEKPTVEGLTRFLLDEVLNLESAPLDSTALGEEGRPGGAAEAPSLVPTQVSTSLSAFEEIRLLDGSRAARYCLRRAEAGRTSSTLLLLHGAGANHHYFAALAEHLAPCELLVPSLPGRCGSDGPALSTAAEAAQWVRGLLTALDLRQVVVVGHSYGGAIAQELALMQAARPVEERLLSGLILMSTGPRLPVDPKLAELFTKQEEAVSTDSALFLLQRTIVREAPEASLRSVAQAMALTPAAAFASDFAACNDFARMDAIKGIDLPTLVLAGSADRLAPSRYAQYLERHIPKSRLVVLEGIGHHPPLEATEKVAEYILSFVDELDVPRGPEARHTRADAN